MRLLLGILVTILIFPQSLLATEVTVRPFLIDKTMVPRESVQETIVLQSSYESRIATLYATVNEISVDTNGEIKEFVAPVMTDRTNSITSWFEISRGRIEVEPGESLEIPLKISIHPFAVPGEYHAFIGFTETNKRYIAEEAALQGEADGVIVKVTVADERVDSMRITNMTVDRVVTRDDERYVEVTVENSGELPSAPTGELIFYNSRGAEVVAVPVNEERTQISPNDSKTFVAEIPFASSLGNFKANVNLVYGQNQRANLYDTTSFFMLPLQYVLMLMGALLFLIILLFILMQRSRSQYVDPADGDTVAMYVRDGHQPNPKDHDIDLTQ